MNSSPENEARRSQDWQSAEPQDSSAPTQMNRPENEPVEKDMLIESRPQSASDSPLPHPESASVDSTHEETPHQTELTDAQPEAQPLLFQSWSAPVVRPVVRIPNFGHLCLLVLLLLFGVLGAGILLRIGLHLHLFGVSTIQSAMAEIHYTLGTEAALYLFTFVACVLIFPLVWHKSFFAGVQWNGRTALRLRRRLLSAACVCFLLALLNGLLMPGPTNTPIEQIFRSPGAAWLLFAFGVTFAPFFEEMFFRGFVLPSLCTAYDWLAEKTTGAPMRPLDENGHPQWSVSAVVVASIATSIPFAAMHAAQTGYSFGPFLLLVGVSLVLCIVRLSTRSLASSVLVHASYNFLLFAIMLLGTDGFRHLDKM
jgi:membrane protease YdiL (CAAX protease family)